jgi:hypothetical protein
MTTLSMTILVANGDRNKRVECSVSSSPQGTEEALKALVIEVLATVLDKPVSIEIGERKESKRRGKPATA